MLYPPSVMVSEMMRVLGSANSSNSNRLREIGIKAGIPAHLVDDASEVDPRWLDGVTRVGITAGASAPEDLVRGLIDRLSAFRTVTVESVGDVHETVEFRLPPALASIPRERDPAPGHALQTGSP